MWLVTSEEDFLAINELNSTSDRAVGIVTASIVELRLERFIKDPGASTASVTTGCLPAATVPPTSRRRASCSPCRPAPNSPRRGGAAALDEPRVLARPWPCCGGRMIIIETFARGCEPKYRPTPAQAAIRIDTS